MGYILNSLFCLSSPFSGRSGRFPNPHRDAWHDSRTPGGHPDSARAVLSRRGRERSRWPCSSGWDNGSEPSNRSSGRGGHPRPGRTRPGRAAGAFSRRRWNEPSWVAARCKAGGDCGMQATRWPPTRNRRGIKERVLRVLVVRVAHRQQLFQAEADGLEQAVLNFDKGEKR